MDTAELKEIFKDQLPGFLGFEVTRLDPDEVEGKLTVRQELCTGGQILHGGAIMAIADTVGAVGPYKDLQPGQVTTTLESKTNFFGAAKIGETVTATSRPLHRGRRTQVWQTDIRRDDGKLLAQVTQTQMILEG